ncbi:MAG TPA: hypothetical protein VGD93_09705, partial [Devosia sp.]
IEDSWAAAAPGGKARATAAASRGSNRGIGGCSGSTLPSTLQGACPVKQQSEGLDRKIKTG